MKKNAEKLVSLGDIAKLAKVSRMAVSLALRNSTSVSEQTRKNVREIATELGYVPDARLSQRMEQVRDSKKREYIPVAWIDLNQEKGLWHSQPYNAPYFNGAQEQCESMGYELQEFRLRQKGMTEKRLSQILYHRGIRGAIIAPSRDLCQVRLDLRWESLSAVTFSRGLVPALPCVLQDDYYNMMLTLRLLHRYGYRRIGVMLSGMENRRSRRVQQAAVTFFQSGLSRAEIVPQLVHVDKSTAGAKFNPWLKKYRPDVIVCQDSRLPEWLAQYGYRVPEDIGLVHLSLDDDCLDWAGIHSRKKEIGAATANAVISMMQNHQVGLPRVGVETAIQGVAQGGKTLLIPKPR